MAKTFKYEDFEEALRQSGMADQFSTADLALAKKNPDAGMSLLSYKQDYANATTDEMRALANAGAEEIRSSYGEYTGGTDGSGFHSTPLSPEAFEYGEAPSYTDNYADRIAQLVQNQQNRQPYSYDVAAPTYESKYGDTIDSLMQDILGREEFSYDHTTDPLYSSYAKRYTREGKRATADALGEAAAATGGMPSSYAVTAATQAGDYYAAQLADKIPELYQIAYDKYLNEYQMKLSDLNAAQGLEQFNYGMHQDALSQYNRDREFDYAKWLDEYEMGQNDIETLRGLRNDEYEQYLTQLGQYNTDRNFNYSQLLDEINSQANEREEKRQAELTQYEKEWNENEREYSREQDAYDRAWNEDERTYEREQDAYLKALEEEDRAYERGQDARKDQLELAKLAAEAGDDSYLRALGINPTAEGEISAEMLGMLKGQYADGVITDEAVWNQLVSRYGEDSLAAAGFTGGEGGGMYNGYTVDEMARTLYANAADLGVTSWDEFKSMLVESGVPKAEAESVTSSYRSKYGDNVFNKNSKVMVNGTEYIDRFDR